MTDMSDKCLRILVRKFYKDRGVTSHVVEHKGADEWAAKVATHDILLSGLKEFVYKSDGMSDCSNWKRWKS